MAKITQLTAATVVNDADELALVQAGKTKRMPASLLSRLNWLGTVAQVEGLPTGSILEYGSNANGEFVKFADGTLICKYSANDGVANLSLSNWFGSTSGVTYYGNNLVTFAHAFVGIPEVCAGVTVARGIFVRDVTSTTANIRLIHFNSITLAKIGYLAIGRWF